MATLFKNTLNSNLIVYLEWSNEPWNSMFAVTQTSYTMGQQLFNTGNYPFLDYDSMFLVPSSYSIFLLLLFFQHKMFNNMIDSGNIWYMAYRWTVWKALVTSNIWRSVWGDCNMGTRVRPVINAQVRERFGRTGSERLRDSIEREIRENRGES